MADAYDRAPWHHAAACRGQEPAEWVPLARATRAALALRATCATSCPVLLECATAAVAEGDAFAIRGGMLPPERLALTRGRVVHVADLSLYLDSAGRVRALDPDASVSLDLPHAWRILDLITAPRPEPEPMRAESAAGLLLPLRRPEPPRAPTMPSPSPSVPAALVASASP